MDSFLLKIHAFNINVIPFLVRKRFDAVKSNPTPGGLAYSVCYLDASLAQGCRVFDWSKDSFCLLNE
jgi:hypothetical protein